MVITRKGKKQINLLIDSVVSRYIKKAVAFPTQSSGNPFAFALLKDFEPLLHTIHGLKTSLGNEMEKIAEIIAVESWGRTNVCRKINRDVKLPRNVFQTIDTIINNLSNPAAKSNYEKEKRLVLDACKHPSRDYENHTYEFDLELYNKSDGHLYFIEMKGPDPNTTEVPGAKKRLLVELAWGYFNRKFTDVDASLAIYYNNIHPRPYRNPKVLYYFDLTKGVLVHEMFWNFLGKDKNTYGELLRIFEDYGKKNKKKIWTGFSRLVSVP